MDQTGNKVSVKIFESTRDRLEMEKIRIRRDLKRAVDYADLIASAIDHVLKGPPAPVAVTPQRAETHREEMELLRFVLEHGSKQEADWIRGNLKMFAEAIRSRNVPSAARRKSGN